MKEFKLKQLFDLQMGKTPKRKESKYWKNGVNDWISISDLSNSRKYINQTSEKITDIAVREFGIKVIPKNTVVMSFKLSIGKVAITEHDMYSNEAVMAFHDRGIETILPEYLYYLLSSKDWNEGANKAVKGITLNKTTLSNIKIKIHKASEQAEIIKILSNIEGQIGYKKDLLIKYDYLIKSRFVEMFNSSFRDKKCYRSIDEICNLIDYRGKTPEKSDSGIPLITAKNVKSNKFDIEPREYIPAENYNSVMTRGYPKINDVLFTTEAPLGNVCRIPDVYDKFCVGQRLITMQPKKDVLTSEYLEMALLSEEFQEEMWRQSSGSTVKGIRSKLLVKIQVPVPDYDSQIQFSRIVQQVDKLKFVILKCQKHKENLYFVYNNYKYGS